MSTAREGQDDTSPQQSVPLDNTSPARPIVRKRAQSDPCHLSSARRDPASVSALTAFSTSGGSSSSLRDASTVNGQSLAGLNRPLPLSLDQTVHDDNQIRAVTRRVTDLTLRDGEDEQGAATLNATVDPGNDAESGSESDSTEPRTRILEVQSRIERIAKIAQDLIEAMRRQNLLGQQSHAVGRAITMSPSQIHVDLTARILTKLNVWFKPEEHDTSTVAENTRINLFGGTQSRRALSAGSMYTAGSNKVGSFSTEDLDIASLQSLGELNIVWTCYASEHLRLESDTSERDDASEQGPATDEPERPVRKIMQSNTLTMYWFDTLDFAWLGPAPLHGWTQEEVELLGLEVIRTWSFLFSHRSKEQTRRAHKAYKRLPIPLGVDEYLDDVSGVKQSHLYCMGDIMSKGLDQYLPVMGQKHLSPNLQFYNSRKHDSYRYSLFKVYGERIRALRKHMDSKKPRTWWELWNDNRDSQVYYTFWGVINLGLSSVVLAFLSLLTSLVQTWAGVKALKQCSTH
ncbi:hypothetical protein B0A48_15197 [Cryoendolithus antarcticus]|uniref:Uncharacterized protein n=1 Tax=Cryoendolithus antarcticus TaxID=1507870 RepID=A0A1V8SJ06_9PEZI|nr:hypothetical protein B0A48_15197 [Cryoendolithus antarcticus]